jgi:hypothetical protein
MAFLGNLTPNNRVSGLAPIRPHQEERKFPRDNTQFRDTKIAGCAISPEHSGTPARGHLRDLGSKWPPRLQPRWACGKQVSRSASRTGSRRLQRCRYGPRYLAPVRTTCSQLERIVGYASLCRAPPQVQVRYACWGLFFSLFFLRGRVPCISVLASRVPRAFAKSLGPFRE